MLAAETGIGGIVLGDAFEKVAEKYPAVGQWGRQEITGLPYPLNVNDKTQLRLATQPNSRIYFYFDEYKKVLAVGLFTGDVTIYTDKTIYETTAGLRATDGILEMKVLYGMPQDISEYSYKDRFGDKIVRRIYYYPDLIVQTRKVNTLPEQIDNILVCKYSADLVMRERNSPIARPEY
ncbi:hypothetical protein RDn1_089 [Candidatus Termititenax dinenymphae]|uniref:Uncharacterized protein n=1 Tax=Candidatus Termititenax dinenymphae TaxID=2218523 RepID=A0A388TKS1_9BACT|nr:hypothetical protein RDn1_089 [Candidatus Termititenax dinenymphae]